MEMGFACKVVLVEFAIALLVLVLEILIMLKLAAGRKKYCRSRGNLASDSSCHTFCGGQPFLLFALSACGYHPWQAVHSADGFEIQVGKPA